MTKTNSGFPEKEAIRLTQLWQNYGPNTYPLDIDELISGALQNSGFRGSLRTKIDSFDSFEGCLARTPGTDKWTILLNDNVENKRRLRFTHAHELGHFMCHRHKRDRFEDSHSTLNDFRDEIESEANVFASWLLLPANILREEFRDVSWNTESLCEIGNRFECSLQAGALRFVSLSNKPIAFVVSRDGMIVWAHKSEKAPYMTAYCFGDELPEASHAVACHQAGGNCSSEYETGFAWNDTRLSRESQYFDYSGLGYQYTCIEFDI